MNIYCDTVSPVNPSEGFNFNFNEFLGVAVMSLQCCDLDLYSRFREVSFFADFNQFRTMSFNLLISNQCCIFNDDVMFVSFLSILPRLPFSW